MSILGKLHWIDDVALMKFILSSQVRRKRNFPSFAAGLDVGRERALIRFPPASETGH